MYVIQSGRPRGEVYDWWVFVTDTSEKADECEAAMEEAINALPAHQYDGWLWGPTSRLDRCGSPGDWKHWNGFEEEPAPQWNGKL